MEESEKFGLIQKIKIDHPDYILFADETGCQKISNRMGMWEIENTLSNTVLYLKSSAAPPTTGLPSFPSLLVQVKLSAASSFSSTKRKKSQ